MHNTYMKRAVTLAATHSLHGDNGPFGAVVVRRGEVVGEGWNRVVESRDPTAHAEIVAIREACQHLGSNVLEDCVLYSSCEPCPMCLAAMYWARIPEFYFACTREDARNAGFDDDMLYRQIQLPPADRMIKAHKMPADEALRVFDQWIKNPNRIPY